MVDEIFTLVCPRTVPTPEHTFLKIILDLVMRFSLKRIEFNFVKSAFCNGILIFVKPGDVSNLKKVELLN